MTLPPIQLFSSAPPPLSIYAIILVLRSSSSLPRHSITQPSITSFFQARFARFRHSHLHTLHPTSFLGLSAFYCQSLYCCLMSTRHPRAQQCYASSFSSHPCGYSLVFFFKKKNVWVFCCFLLGFFFFFAVWFFSGFLMYFCMYVFWCFCVVWVIVSKFLCDFIF